MFHLKKTLIKKENKNLIPISSDKISSENNFSGTIGCQTIKKSNKGKDFEAMHFTRKSVLLHIAALLAIGQFR